MSESFHNLSSALQRSIDEAFDLAVSSTAQKYAISIDGGGFMVDETPETHIFLSSVPQALAYLNLPPGDEQVLAVFHNAASGWSSATNNINDRHPLGKLVSRDDWRSVCAVLLEERQEENNEGSVRNSTDGDTSEGDVDEYRSSASSENSGGEYEETGKSHSCREEHASYSSTGSLRRSSKKHVLDTEQREACLGAYSLFFPGVPLEDVTSQKITVQEIQLVADTLREKLTTVEIKEMLEMFSSLPDKSMTFTDFSGMMATAKLV